ncbi:MAG: thioredoxin family protein [Mollicutes bacterium]|jgi:thiol-disulfide isomerase/thioredoxin|nr:thioredoxin family protein [Mollicutes bacterium]
MKTGVRKIIIGVVALLIIIVPMIIDNNAKALKPITYEEFQDKLTSGSKSIIYFDYAKSKVSKQSYANLSSLKNKKGRELYYVNIDNLTEKEKKSIEEANSQILKGNAFAFIDNKTIIEVRRGLYSPSDLEILDNQYFDNAYEQINYKVSTDAKEFIDRANKEEILMVTFGRTSCSFCEMFKPTLNKIARTYELDVYYFDYEFYDQSEYNEIMAQKYIIPGRSKTISDDDGYATCSNSGVDTTIDKGFNTPLTLLIHNGKTIDCILGALSEERVTDALEFYKIEKSK